MRPLSIVLIFVWVFADAAEAQSVYVAGALGGDILLASGQELSGLTPPPGGGEALSGAARLGVVLDRWGVELEVSRAAEIRDTFRPNIAYGFVGARPALALEIEQRTRLTTVSATASIRQRVSDDVALSYLGGLVFHRTDTRTEYPALRGFAWSSGYDVVSAVTVQGFAWIDAPSVSVAPSASRQSVRYGAGPVVGLEAHIGYGEHFAIIPGVRMHGLPGSWLVRPSVGAGWSF